MSHRNRRRVERDTAFALDISAANGESFAPSPYILNQASSQIRFVLLTNATTLLRLIVIGATPAYKQNLIIGASLA
jgi:hypothetical protein